MYPVNNGQFSFNRYALMFKQGKHDVNVDVGYYVSVYGLGRSPTDTVLANMQVLNSAEDYHIGALNNFWRSAENVHVTPEGGVMTWAVSQAIPLRRIVVTGNLNLFASTGGPAGYASGGYMADITVSGTIYSGSQQQFMMRNVDMGAWEGGVLNMVFVGSKGAPKSHCG
jgi:hypothetical protein